MKSWLWFVVCTIICWGAYVPTLHHGQQAFGDRNSALRAFLFVGLAYCIVGIAVLIYIRFGHAEPWTFTSGGVSLSTIAGILGALGALGITFALKAGGKPIWVAPLVFAGAPVVNTLVSLLWNKPAQPPRIWFYAGLLLAALGAAIVLRFKPT